jgi:hypothetical protein
MRAGKSAGVRAGTEAFALGGLTEALPNGWEEQAIAARRNAAAGGTAKSLDTEGDQGCRACLSAPFPSSDKTRWNPDDGHGKFGVQPAAVWSSSSNSFQSGALRGLAPDARKIIATAVGPEVGRGFGDDAFALHS